MRWRLKLGNFKCFAFLRGVGHTEQNQVLSFSLVFKWGRNCSLQKISFQILKNLCFELGFGGYILIFINTIAEYDSMDEDPFFFCNDFCAEIIDLKVVIKHTWHFCWKVLNIYECKFRAYCFCKGSFKSMGLELIQACHDSFFRTYSQSLRIFLSKLLESLAAERKQSLMLV